MASQIQTTNLALTLPGDDSHNTPWGALIKLITDAINLIDSLILAGIQKNQWTFAVDTGTANTYAAAISPAPSLVAGTGLLIKMVHANTGASTLALNGGSAKAITKNGATALAGAEISANQIAHLVYDGTQWQLITV